MMQDTEAVHLQADEESIVVVVVFAVVRSWPKELLLYSMHSKDLKVGNAASGHRFSVIYCQKCCFNVSSISRLAPCEP